MRLTGAPENGAPVVFWRWGQGVGVADRAEVSGPACGATTKDGCEAKAGHI